MYLSSGRECLIPLFDLHKDSLRYRVLLFGVRL